MEAVCEEGSVQQEIGGGISGAVNGLRVALGSWKWVAQHLNESPSQDPNLGPTTSAQLTGSMAVQQNLQVGMPSHVLAGVCLNLELQDHIRTVVMREQTADRVTKRVRCLLCRCL